MKSFFAVLEIKNLSIDMAVYLPSASCVCFVSTCRLYSDEGFDSTKSVYTAKLKELTDLGEPVENRLYETNNRQVCYSLPCWLFAMAWDVVWSGVVVSRGLEVCRLCYALHGYIYMWHVM